MWMFPDSIAACSGVVTLKLDGLGELSSVYCPDIQYETSVPALRESVEDLC